MDSEQDPVTTAGADPEKMRDAVYPNQDFTIGRWEMFDGETKIAEFENEAILGGHSILQRMQIVGGGSAVGLTAYAPSVGLWHYLLTSDVGITTLFTGTVTAEGKVLYSTEAPLDDGGIKHRKWSLSLNEDGSVREASIASTDDGKSWETEYDLLWKRHAPR